MFFHSQQNLRMAKAKKCANPLFEQWLKEWQDEAKARDLQMQFCFGKALDSLRRYPLVLETGRDCIILKHFGHKLCDMLDKKLSQHKLLNNLPSSSNDGSKKPRKRERKKTESGDAQKNDSPSLPEGTCSSPNKISSNSSKEVINDDSLPAKKRKDPIEFAEIDKNIENISGVSSSNVSESNNKAKPKADEPIQMHTKEIAISNDKNKKTTKKTEIPAEINTEVFYLLPNNFDIILLVDTQETSGLKAKAKNDATVSELSKQGVVFEIRSLNVGDFTWIARCRFTKKELVLPYIVERKRIDDLCASIKDSRYHEQKFRLKQSGIKNVIYLIENYGKSYHGCIPMTSLLQAGVNALVQDDFKVKYTRDHKDSMRYLSTMTTILTNIFEKFKIREMFIKQLLQLKGLSVDKAVAIAELYPTPKILSNALKQSDDKLLADVVAGPNKRKIGPAISKTVYQLYTKYDLS
ncbi:unnamed protein product [Trichogramma brassicae]|uniref:Crossover junction endonuclease MUS81 n=1 Tax=Trichogramma brassicae TaxID=86971 RepID=A0A6H5IAG1_9HYME|nr:unnamed protein product [Trichogramma brassicae]